MKINIFTNTSFYTLTNSDTDENKIFTCKEWKNRNIYFTWLKEKQVYVYLDIKNNKFKDPYHDENKEYGYSQVGDTVLYNKSHLLAGSITKDKQMNIQDPKRIDECTKIAYEDIFPKDKEVSNTSIKIGSHWERLCPRFKAGEIIIVNEISNDIITYNNWSRFIHRKDFFNTFTPRPDLDTYSLKPNNSVIQTSDSIYYSCSNESINKNQLKQKETTMNNKFDLKLLLSMMGIPTEEEETKDATNSELVGIMTTNDGNYEGYVYGDTIEEFNKIMQQSCNEGKHLHVFNYQTTLSQKPRKVIQIKRETKEV